jgi:hypothetical protein
MNISTEDRVSMLAGITATLTEYTNINGNYRPAIPDVATYDTLLSLYEMDAGETEPEYLWRKKPNEVMTEIINANMIFTLEYGWDDLYESVRDWITDKDFVAHRDELTDEEYQQLMEAE